jgi:hypothetical protein
MINWQYFPKSNKIPSHLKSVVGAFEQIATEIDSAKNEHNSNAVLEFLREGLEQLNFEVEKSKKKVDKIHVPVLFGRNGKLEKYFEADGLNKETKTVIEVEAGRGVTNYQFLKDLFQACLMHDVEYLIIAIRNTYKKSKDFEKVTSFMDSIYVSNRLELPLKGILIIGY